jgi:hypothetical protein
MKKVMVPLKQNGGIFAELKIPRHFIVSIGFSEKQSDGSYKRIEPVDTFDYKSIVEAFYQSNHDGKLSIWLNCRFIHGEIEIIKKGRRISLKSS